MKHTLHSISNGHILCDIFDDNDNLIIGNYMHNLPANFEEAQTESVFVDSIYPAIEYMINPVVSDKVQIEASPVLVAMESAKEQIKWALISYIKNNPEITLDDIIDYTELNFGWENAGLVLKMISEYVKLAEQKGILTLADNSKEYFFAVIKSIILSSTDEQLQEMLS